MFLSEKEERENERLQIDIGLLTRGRVLVSEVRGTTYRGWWAVVFEVWGDTFMAGFITTAELWWGACLVEDPGSLPVEVAVLMVHVVLPERMGILGPVQVLADYK